MRKQNGPSFGRAVTFGVRCDSSIAPSLTRETPGPKVVAVMPVMMNGGEAHGGNVIGLRT